MAVELMVEIEDAITTDLLTSGTTEVIKQITGATVPSLGISSLENGQSRNLVDPISIVSDGMIQLGIESAGANVTINVTPSFEHENKYDCAISSEYSRSAVEVVIVLSCAIWLGQKFDTIVHDEWQFWTEKTSISANELLDKLKNTASYSFHEACIAVAGGRVTQD